MERSICYFFTKGNMVVLWIVRGGFSLLALKSRRFSLW